MRHLCLWIFVLISVHSYSQNQDTTQNSVEVITKNYSYSQGKSPFDHYVINDGSVNFKSSGFGDSQLFEKIVGLEMRECDALKARDSIELMMLWVRDFTLDETQSLVSNKGGIPFYIGLSRTIEKVTPIDSVTVMCTGIEFQRQIGTYHTDTGEKKNFFHIWTKINGVWKLTTRRTE